MKKHKHKWGKWTLEENWAKRYCQVAGCSIIEYTSPSLVERILNGPKYVKVGTVEGSEAIGWNDKLLPLKTGTPLYIRKGRK